MAGTMKRISDILTIASQLSCISTERLIGLSRLKRVVRVRQACYLVARECGHTYPQIGKYMHRDHSSVIYGAQKALDIAERDQVYSAFLDRLRRLSKSSAPFVAERLNAILVSAPAPVKRKALPPKPKPPRIDPSALDDMDLLSALVCAHYAEQRV